MQEQCQAIGEAAGKIYKILEKHGAQTASKLQKDTAVSDSALFNQSLGWLARENKIRFSKSGKTTEITL